MREFLHILLEDDEENDQENEQVMIKMMMMMMMMMLRVTISSAYKNIEIALKPEFRQREYTI